jgi:hypothetical protein
VLLCRFGPRALSSASCRFSAACADSAGSSAACQVARRSVFWRGGMHSKRLAKRSEPCDEPQRARTTQPEPVTSQLRRATPQATKEAGAKRSHATTLRHVAVAREGRTSRSARRRRGGTRRAPLRRAACGGSAAAPSVREPRRKLRQPGGPVRAHERGLMAARLPGEVNCEAEPKEREGVDGGCARGQRSKDAWHMLPRQGRQAPSRGSRAFGRRGWRRRRLRRAHRRAR